MREPIWQDWPVLSQANLEVTPEELSSVLTGWTETDHGTLARRLANGIRGAVAAGVIADGSRLPPERALAQALAVSRSTITAALQHLRDERIVLSRQGSGSVVQAVGTPTPTSRVAQHFSPFSGIDLAAGNPPDPSHWPSLQLDVADLIADGAGPGVQPLGLEPLREALAERHSAAGLLTDPSQIHITSGGHQAIALVVAAHAGRGDLVAVEDTSYPGIFDIIDHLGARALPLSADRAGLLPDALDRALAEYRPPVLYVQGGPHNPTGRAPSPGRLRALATVLDRHDTAVIEDCALAELTFSGRVRPELADLCRKAAVTSVGSFSKVAWAGLRLGWMRAPAPLIQRTMHRRLANDLGTSVPSQLLALRLLPRLDEMAAERRQTLEQLVGRAVALLREDLPEWKVQQPDGGSVLWAELPVPDSGPLVQLAYRYGVQVAPGSIARAGRVPDPHVRICVDRPWTLVETGLRRALLAWHELRRRPDALLGRL